MTPLAVERATIAAWPAAITEHHFGWSYLAADGITGRVNAIWPLAFDGDDPEAAIAHAAEWCKAHGIKPRFKLTEGAIEPPNLISILQSRGFTTDGAQTLLMIRPLDSSPLTDPEVALSANLSSDFASVLDTTTSDPAERAERRAIAERALPVSAYAALTLNGRPAAIGMTGVTHGLAGIFLMRTIPEARRQGCARRILHTLLAHTAKAGASHAYLQVDAANTPAVELYAAEGFTRLAAYEFWALP